MSFTQINIDASLVRQLVATQFPSWSNLAITPVELGGNDNKTFHLGDEMLVRLPSAERYSQQVKTEQLWLPKLGSLLPLSIPAPLAMGVPACGYLWKELKMFLGKNSAIS